MVRHVKPEPADDKPAETLTFPPGPSPDAPPAPDPDPDGNHSLWSDEELEAQKNEGK